MKKILVFGNPLSRMDSAAVKIARKLSKKFPNISFVRFDTSEDLEAECPNLIILDAVVGLQNARIVTLEELELSAKPLSLHGFDLTWSLLLLKKLGRLRTATIIGVPAKKPAKESLPQVEKLIRRL